MSQSPHPANPSVWKIGVLGGTFDPPHLGHLAIAHAAIESLGLDEVLFMPAYRNPLKGRESARPDDRMEMVKRLIKNEPNLAVSDIELTRRGPSYAVESLTELQIVRPGQYWFIMGSDSLKEFELWKAPERLLRLCRLAVINRDPRREFTFPTSFPSTFVPHVDIVPMKTNPASSTEIRELLVQKRSVSASVPDSVLSYIREHRLYEP
jgi:nicotinate-nucleotide adenylyltransferase